MYKISVNESKPITVNLTSSNTAFEGNVNEMLVKGSFVKLNDFQFHLLYNNQSYNIDIIKFNVEEKTITLRINSEKHTVVLKDKYDELLHSLGLDKLAQKKISDVKAPMPGMVLNILVSEGQSVKKGEALIILEAMKMENILKCAADGVIKKIAVNKGTAVEKNQLLIQF